MAGIVTIRLEVGAPEKPPVGQPCNGCGVCCAAELCPLGIALYLRRTGPCPALTWDKDARLYRCGVLDRPTGLVRHLPRAWIRRWIAAGTGCDSDARIMPG